MSTTNDYLNISDQNPNILNNLFDSLNFLAKDKDYDSCPDYNVHEGNSNYVTAEDAFLSNIMNIIRQTALVRFASMSDRGGGVGFYVKKSLTFWLRNDVSFFCGR